MLTMRNNVGLKKSLQMVPLRLSLINKFEDQIYKLRPKICIFNEKELSSLCFYVCLSNFISLKIIINPRNSKIRSDLSQRLKEQ